jgi:flavodoxin
MTLFLLSQINSMKTLIIYYSRTGFTKKVAEVLQQKLNCDIEEIFDTTDRSGMKGYLLAGRDAMKQKLTTLKETKLSPTDYDLVVIGTPLWAFTMSTPIKTYLNQNKDKFKKVAFFLTSGSTPGTKTFTDMAKEISQTPVATLELRTKEVMDNKIEEKINEFNKKIV